MTKTNNNLIGVSINVSIIFLAFFALAFAQTNPLGSSAGMAGLSISNATLYIPYPAEPGKYIDLWIRVQYTGTTGSAENVQCELNPAFPFSIEPGDPGIANIGLLTSYQEFIVKYRVRIDQNAVAGTNSLKFRCKMKGFDYSEIGLPIYIQPQDAVLVVEKIESDPETFGPGQTGDVKITLKNIATVTLKDIAVKYDISSADLPLSPVKSTIEKRIALLQPGESAVAEFNIATDPDAAEKTYKIPLILTYYDTLGKNYTRNTTTSLQIQTKPDLMMLHEQTAIVKNGTKNTITVSIINRGISQIKFLTASLGDPADGEFQILSPTEVYVGDINSEDSETATYDLYIDTTEKYAQLPITVNFKDLSGNSYTKQSNVKVRIFSKEEAIQYGLEKAVQMDPIILAIGGLIILYILYRIIKGVVSRKS